MATAHPELIHPALWCASRLRSANQATVSTGFPQLDRELPGGGWPLGALTELGLEQPGAGEVSLLRSVMARLANWPIMLVHPPGAPCIHCCTNWRIDWRRLVWVAPRGARDTLWAAEQILRHSRSTIVLCWVTQASAVALRRLQLAARGSNALFFLLRPASALHQPCAAPLRLQLRATASGLEIRIAKRQGPLGDAPLSIPLHDCSVHHAALDKPALSPARP